MEYCRDMVDDSLMERQFETIQKDSDYDWYLYHGEMTISRLGKNYLFIKKT